MTTALTDEALRSKGFQVLEKQLGPVQTLRFLGLISQTSFDYQKWREERFGEMTVDEILSAAAR